MSDWGDSLGFVRLQLMMLPGNEASARIATKAGFNEEGLLRAYVKQRGSIKDVVMWSRVKQQCREEAVVWASVRQCHPAEGKASRGITKTLPSVFAAFT